MGRRQGWGWLGSLALLSLALAPPARAGSPSCETTAERFQLPNGLEVVLVPDASLPAIAMVSSVHVGSRNDPPDHAGLAHYLEHLTYRQAPPFASVFDLYDEIGATEVNATTGPDTTDYVAMLPAAQLERGLWIEARRLGLGLAALSEPAALEERRVVLREQELRYGYQPILSLATLTYATLFPGAHPYHAPFASVSSLEQLSSADARWFFAEYYRPERTRLVLVGDLQPSQARALVERHFGALVAPAMAAKDPTSECSWAKKQLSPTHSRLRLRSRYRNESIDFYFPVGPEEDPQLLAPVFDNLRSEIAEVARQTGLAHEVYGELVSRELGSYWMISIGVAPGQPFEKVEPLVSKIEQNLRASFADKSDLVARGQALELSERLAQPRLMARALNLARRECVPSVCVDASKLLTPSLSNQVDRFALSKALIVERRYSVGASEDGSLESLP